VIIPVKMLIKISTKVKLVVTEAFFTPTNSDSVVLSLNGTSPHRIYHTFFVFTSFAFSV